MTSPTAEQLDRNDRESPDIPIAVVALKSDTLTAVVKARFWLSIGLVLASVVAMTVGTLIILFGPSGTDAAQIIETSNFRVSSSGFGAIFMTTSILFGFLALRSRPRLDLYPTSRGASVSVDGRLRSGVSRDGSVLMDGDISSDDSDDDDEPDPPPSAPAGAGLVGKASLRSRVLNFKR